ncbi:hypothetical protein [Streptomyces prasinus]
MTSVQGRCPACGGSSLFLGEGGHVTCSRLDCPAPAEADDLLHGRDSVYAIGQALGGGRVARLIAYALASHEHSLADVRRMTDEQLRAIPGIGDESLARIRAAIPAPEAVSPAVDATVLAALRIALTRADEGGYELSPQYLLDFLGEARVSAADSAATEPELSDPAECSGEAGPCPEHGHHEHSLKQPGEAASSPLRDQIAEALLDHLSRTADIRPGRSGELAFMPEVTDAERLRIADAVLTVLDPHGDTGFALERGHRCFLENHVARLHDTEEAVKRVRAESARIRAVTRTWEPVADLIDAALDGTDQPTGCRCHNGDELCSGCHRCPNICHGCDGPEHQPTVDGKEVGDDRA